MGNALPEVMDNATHSNSSRLVRQGFARLLELDGENRGRHGRHVRTLVNKDLFTITPC